MNNVKKNPKSSKRRSGTEICWPARLRGADEGMSEATMNRPKRIWQWHTIILVLFAGFFLPVSAQSQELESLHATTKGHGMITSAAEEREITSVVVILRQNGTVLVTACAELELRAEGTWRT